MRQCCRPVTLNLPDIFKVTDGECRCTETRLHCFVLYLARHQSGWSILSRCVAKATDATSHPTHSRQHLPVPAGQLSCSSCSPDDSTVWMENIADIFLDTWSSVRGCKLATRQAISTHSSSGAYIEQNCILAIYCLFHCDLTPLTSDLYVFETVSLTAVIIFRIV